VEVVLYAGKLSAEWQRDGPSGRCGNRNRMTVKSETESKTEPAYTAHHR